MRAASWSIVCFAAALAAQAGPEQLLAQLAGEGRADAHAQLVTLGAAAVPALSSGLGTDAKEVTIERLQREIGPPAGGAVPELTRLFLRARIGEVFNACLETLADLVPFRPGDATLTELQVVTVYSKMPVRYQAIAPRLQVQQQRLIVRLRFDRDQPVDELIAVARGRRALRVELAVQLLGECGAGARSALPALCELLEREDPRILCSGDALPLRAASARAILAIDPDGHAAERARAVLAGAKPAPVPAVPERARGRALELAALLAQPQQRSEAATNLEALGGWVAPDVAALLTAEHDHDTRMAALSMITRLGRDAVAAVPRLYKALRALPTEDTLAVMSALLATAPYSRDVLPGLSWTFSARRLALFGRELRGSVDTDFYSAFLSAADDLAAALAVDTHAALDELEGYLESESVLVRERALMVLPARGAAARPLLGELGAMLTAEQPKARTPNRLPVDHDAIVHRLAAEAILAIAAPDNPLVERAHAVLRAAEGK